MKELSPRFDSTRLSEALVFAARLHAGQVRKGTDIPYLTHLLSVASLVIEYGGGEDEAIAALLHDAVEDQGGLPTYRTIRRRFGRAVAEIVRGCTDSHTSPKPPWKARKLRYLAHLRDADLSVRLVSAADKLHNARSILMGYREVDDQVWDRFTAGKQETLWYYRTLSDTFLELGPAALAGELDRVVRMIEGLALSGTEAEAHAGATL